ncbi:MAG: hypothetical protein Q7S33_03285, partial [Nanoarchaeota archaeon]|nr:hypothetical protein [Nanoarchaeota archaeon]
MDNKKILGVVVLVFGILFFISLVSAVTFSPTSSGLNNPTTDFSNPVGYQAFQPSFSSYYSSEQIRTYWPAYSQMQNDQCNATSDFIISIRPGGCTPAVVRSDLLAEQNVPVFCQLDAIKINPLIKVSSIKSISFTGKYPEGVAGISFHPARAAVRSNYNDLLGSPLINNIGYVVIILKKNAKENTLQDFISGNLTATIRYDAEQAYGTGQSEYYIPDLTDNAKWESNYVDYGFWQGKGFIRATEIENGKAKIQLYSDKNHVFNTITLEEGKESGIMYFPGFYCRAGLKVKLNKVVSPEKQARISIDGQELWVRKGTKILNDKCYVKDITALTDGTGTISISCSGQQMNLVIQQLGAKISLPLPNGEVNNYHIGDSVYKNSDGKNVYLLYTGKVPSKVQPNSTKKFIIMAASAKEISQADLLKISQKINQISELTSNTNFAKYESEIKKAVASITSAKIEEVLLGIEKEKTQPSFVFEGLIEQEDSVYIDKTSGVAGTAELVENYFSESDTSTANLLESYPYEKEAVNNTYFGETNLLKQIDLAMSIGKSASAKKYIELFIKIYPDSKSIEFVKDKLLLVSNFDYSKAYTIAYVNNNYHNIMVDKFKPLDITQKNVQISVDGMYYPFAEGDRIGLGENVSDIQAKDHYILIDSINDGKVNLIYYYDEKDREQTEQLKTISIQGDSIFKDRKNIVIREINVDKIAYVSLIPEVDYTGSKADFTFKVGIEKRGIQLSPEKTKEMITSLDSSIKEWQGVGDKLTNVIKTGKAACFLTSSVLTAKNLVSGVSGESMARQKVMKYYRQSCDEKIAANQEGLTTRTECYNKYADAINKDVADVSKAIDETNTQIRSIQDKYKTGNIIVGESIDSQKSLADLRAQLLTQYNGENGKIIVSLPDENGNNVQKIIDVELLNTDSIRELILLKKIDATQVSSGTLKLIEKNSANLLQPLIQESQNKDYVASLGNKLSTNPDLKIGQIGTEQIGRQTYVWTKQTIETAKLKGVTGDANSPVEVFTYKNSAIFAYVFSVVDDNLIPLKSYSWDGSANSFVEISKDSGMQKLDSEAKNTYNFVKAGNCNNAYKSIKIRYYETEPNVQLPAIVPFDSTNGWYVKVPQATGGIASNVEKGYKASGEPSYYYICNVGENGLEENMQGGDICQSFNTNDDVKTFGGCSLTEEQVSKLKNSALSAIRQAAQQYGKSKVTINGVKGIITLDKPMSESAVECQDFMSPEECKLLFNVCDPVICPSSRCDLGGKYPVANVVQTGIIGSILLCLPNYKEGVKVPVCLTGINAGVDSYVSILKSEKSCLQKSLDTGEKIGICDEITSVYKCEFFWSQAAPIMNLILPKFIENVAGTSQSARGGGEYLSVMNAWNNMQSGVDFFKNNYAQNSFRAFQIKSVEQAGSTFCQSFIGGTIPTSAKLLDSLLEPESPFQVNAWFSESIFSDVTVPSTSHYKIYYHLFAGKDKGVNYAVYLSSPPASGYYKQSPQILIKSGYIARGQTADEALDFTSPSGYKELCVVVDAQSYCGFGQVSTSFALNYLQSKYAAEQANQSNINSEKECISGSPSLLPLVNPNIQSGVENAVSPDISLKGIVRVCATSNPGANVNENARWQEVGDCGSSNLKCWLDGNSVAKDIAKVSTIENTLSEIESNFGLLNNNANPLSEQDTQSKLDLLGQNIKNLRIQFSADKLKGQNLDSYIKTNTQDIISELDSVSSVNLETTSLNQEKAQAIGLKAEVYRIITRALIELGVDIQKPEPVKFAEEKVAATTEEQTPGYKIWLAAKSLVGSNIVRKTGSGSIDEYNVCARFVSTVLNNAGVSGFEVKPTACTLDAIDNLIIIFDKRNSEFQSVSDFKNLQKGDLVIFGKGTEKTQHITVFSNYNPLDKNKLQVYGEPGSKGVAQLQEFTATKTSTSVWYVYKVYRYTGNLNQQSATTSTSTDSSEVSTTYEQRYSQYDVLFTKYSKQNLPNNNFLIEVDFKSLLVAIAQKESSLGTQGNLLMGYGDNLDNRAEYQNNPELQISSSSTILKNAFENKDANYNECNSKTDKTEKERCILSIYNMGAVNSQGYSYADMVMGFQKDWFDYFTSGSSEVSSVSKTALTKLEKFEIISSYLDDMDVLYLNSKYSANN